MKRVGELYEVVVFTASVSKVSYSKTRVVGYAFAHASLVR